MDAKDVESCDFTLLEDSEHQAFRSEWVFTKNSFQTKVMLDLGLFLSAEFKEFTQLISDVQKIGTAPFTIKDKVSAKTGSSKFGGKLFALGDGLDRLRIGSTALGHPFLCMRMNAYFHSWSLS